MKSGCFFRAINFLCGFVPGAVLIWVLFGHLIDSKAQAPETYQGSGLVLFPMTPCRLVDTRIPPLAIVQPLERRTIQVTKPRNPDGSVNGRIGTCAIDPAVKAIAANITVLPTQTLGYLTIWPAGEMPIVSTLNATQGGIVNAQPVLVLSAAGSFEIFSTDETHMIVDISAVYAWDGVTPHALPPAPIPTKK